MATGGPAIETVNRDYQRRRAVLNAGLRGHGIAPPFPWRDLWGWHGAWKEISGTYAGRREYISKLATPAHDQLERLVAGRAATDTGSTSDSWPALERRLVGLHGELRAASSLDDLQDVGRRSRDVLIDLAVLVYDDDMLPENETEQPKAGDAKNRLAFAAQALMPGSSHARWRVLIRAAWDLANTITHSSSIDSVDAFAAVQATVLLVRTFEQAAAAAGARTAAD